MIWWSRRQLIRLFSLAPIARAVQGAGLLFVGTGCRAQTAATVADPPVTALVLDDQKLKVLSAIGEALIPEEDDAAGIEGTWMAEFVRRRIAEKAELESAYAGVALSVSALALEKEKTPFEQLPLPAREAVLRMIAPDLRDVPGLTSKDRELRMVLREMMRGFFYSDHLDLENPLAPANHDWNATRDSTQPSTLEYATAGDWSLAVDGMAFAEGGGSGDFYRAWAAGGYASYPPGVCKSVEDVVSPGGPKNTA